MWVFTEDGFFSTVVIHDEHRELVVRSRAKDNLISFINKMDGAYTFEDVECTPDRDYPWRIFVKREDWAKYLYDYAKDDLCYTNFKDYIRKIGPHSESSRRMHAIGDVWNVMYDYEDRPMSGPIKSDPARQAWLDFVRSKRD